MPIIVPAGIRIHEKKHARPKKPAKRPEFGALTARKLLQPSTKATGPGGPPDSVYLAIPHQTQIPYYHMCWAASGVMATYPNTPSMCEVATSEFQTACCPDPDAAGCDKNHWPDDYFRNLGYNRIGRALSYDEIKDHVWNRGCPIAPVFYLNGTAVHMLIVQGVNSGYAYVNDPLTYSESLWTYDQLVASKYGSWQETYVDARFA